MKYIPPKIRKLKKSSRILLLFVNQWYPCLDGETELGKNLKSFFTLIIPFLNLYFWFFICFHLPFTNKRSFERVKDYQIALPTPNQTQAYTQTCLWTLICLFFIITENKFESLTDIHLTMWLFWDVLNCISQYFTVKHFIEAK